MFLRDNDSLVSICGDRPWDVGGSRRLGEWELKGVIDLRWSQIPTFRDK